MSISNDKLNDFEKKHDFKKNLYKNVKKKNDSVYDN